MDDNIKNIGFAIVTLDEHMIEDNAREDLGRELTSKDWEALNEDLSQMENNALIYLKEVIYSARDEGHGSDDSLIGTAWYDEDNPEHVDFVMSRSLQAENVEHEYDPKGIFYEGLSEDGKSILADTLRIEFFDITDEDYEEWEDAQ